MKTSTLALSAVLLLLAGCTALGPKYTETPVADLLKESFVAEDTREEALPKVSDAEAVKLDSWWTQFNDPSLNRLLAKAFLANNNLEAARANLAAARATWEYQKGALWPSVNASGDLTRYRTSETGLNASNSNRRYTDYQVGVGATWELDLFGRLTYLADAAEAEAQATEADLKAMWVSVSSQLATYYVELRTLQGRLMVAEDNLKLQQANYDLLYNRTQGGLTTDLATSQAEYDMRNTAATIPSLKAQIVSAESSIAILCGITPGTLPEDVVNPPLPPDENAENTSESEKELRLHTSGLRDTNIPQSATFTLDGGIPADSIRRRPDVYAAERRLKSAVDYVGSAEAERYPIISISGNIGLESLHFSDLWDWDSHFYNFGPGISLPIFRGGQIVANIKVKTEQQKAALATYRNTVLSALGEIRTALAGFTNEQERLEQLRLGVQAAQRAYEISANSYDAGLGDFFDVLDAQRQLFSLDDARVISEGTIVQQQIALYEALCGGWEGNSRPQVADELFGGDLPPEPLLPTPEEMAAEEPATAPAPAEAAPVEAAPAATPAQTSGASELDPEFIKTVAP